MFILIYSSGILVQMQSAFLVLWDDNNRGAFWYVESGFAELGWLSLIELLAWLLAFTGGWMDGWS